MICWDRSESQVIGNFSPRQVRWIRDHVGNLRHALQVTKEQAESEVGRHFSDPLAQMKTVPGHGRQDITGGGLPDQPAWWTATSRMIPGLTQLQQILTMTIYLARQRKLWRGWIA
jgi:hypothetical protein